MCTCRKMGKVTNLITDIVGMFSGGSLNTALTFYAKPLEAFSPDPYSLNPPDSRCFPLSWTSRCVGQTCLAHMSTTTSPSMVLGDRP